VKCRPCISKVEVDGDCLSASVTFKCHWLTFNKWRTPDANSTALYEIPLVTVRRRSFVKCVKQLGLTTYSNSQQGIIDRRLRPRCCHLGSYFKRPKSSPVRPSACNWYYCAQFIAKPKAACALRFSWATTSSNLDLWANMTSSIKPGVHNVSLRRHSRTEPRP